MFSRSIRRAGLAGALAATTSLGLAVAAQAKAPQTLTVCKHGCRYSTIQSAGSCGYGVARTCRIGR